MSHNFTSELGRMRTEEAIARADRYRLAHKVRRDDSRPARLSWSKKFAFRRGLAAVGLSSLIVVGLGAAALASPMGPGANGDGVVNVTATKEHQGTDSGQPARSEHAYESGAEGNTDPNAVALELRAEYYAQRLGTAAGTGTWSVDKVADARSLNEPSSSNATDAVAQLRALNEPGTTAQGASLEASDSPETDFPLAQSVAVIAGILVLLAGAVIVTTRNKQSPKTV